MDHINGNKATSTSRVVVLWSLRNDRCQKSDKFRSAVGDKRLFPPLYQSILFAIPRYLCSMTC